MLSRNKLRLGLLLAVLQLFPTPTYSSDPCDQLTEPTIANWTYYNNWNHYFSNDSSAYKWFHHECANSCGTGLGEFFQSNGYFHNADCPEGFYCDHVHNNCTKVSKVALQPCASPSYSGEQFKCYGDDFDNCGDLGTAASKLVCTWGPPRGQYVESNRNGYCTEQSHCPAGQGEPAELRRPQVCNKNNKCEDKKIHDEVCVDGTWGDYTHIDAIPPPGADPENSFHTTFHSTFDGNNWEIWNQRMVFKHFAIDWENNPDPQRDYAWDNSNEADYPIAIRCYRSTQCLEHTGLNGCASQRCEKATEDAQARCVGDCWRNEDCVGHPHGDYCNEAEDTVGEWRCNTVAN